MTPLNSCRLFLGAWEDSSPEAISRLFAEMGVFTNPLQPRPLIGPRQIFDAVSVGLAKIENVTIRVSNAWEQGSQACVEGEFLARKRGDGGRFDFPFMLVLELEEGSDKISRLSEYFDTARLR
ncbi:nuclear transport factor 2 family protein [Taklimakanibacter lacteus]|uniref:nuclear transport factor 2 family protein n=1 Tax=Taklimakanibacter lacteus TaxID=2268456 RepID=UPI000E661CC0